MHNENFRPAAHVDGSRKPGHMSGTARASAPRAAAVAPAAVLAAEYGLEQLMGSQADQGVLLNIPAVNIVGTETQVGCDAGEVLAWLVVVLPCYIVTSARPFGARWMPALPAGLVSCLTPCNSVACACRLT